MTIIEKEKNYIIDRSDWDNLYMATPEGDIFRTIRKDPDAWRPVYSINARVAVWNRLNASNKRIPWREDNGKDIEIPGFERKSGQLCFWYVCQTCDTPYTDMPDTVKDLQDHGCSQPNCTAHKETPQ